MPALLIVWAEMAASPHVKDVSSEQIGSALRRLAADLVAERRRVVELERENRELRAQLEARKHDAGEAAKRPSVA